MHTTFNRRSVVDQLTAELAERRRTATTRRAAYLALAHAILSGAQHEQRALVAASTLDQQHGLGVRAVVAA